MTAAMAPLHPPRTRRSTPECDRTETRPRWRSPMAFDGPLEALLGWLMPAGSKRLVVHRRARLGQRGCRSSSSISERLPPPLPRIERRDSSPSSPSCSQSRTAASPSQPHAESIAPRAHTDSDAAASNNPCREPAARRRMERAAFDRSLASRSAASGWMVDEADEAER